MKLTYAEQLKHPNWQRRRLEMLEHARFECTNCGDTETTLHVHHKQYIKGRMAWQYSNAELEVLCEKCHAIEHLLAADLKDLLANVSTAQALAILRGFYVFSDWFSVWSENSGYDSGPQYHAVGLIAYLCQSLRAEDLSKVAQFAASLTKDLSEERMRMPEIERMLREVP